MIERNDPCWCGSGKKYKKCHLATDQSQPKTGPGKNMDPRIKRPEEIAAMRRAGAFNGELMDYIRPFIKAGVSTDYINRLAHEYTLSHGHTPACLGYRNFPKSVCTSINDVVCHGIPSEKEILKEGDIINVDLTTIVDGFYGDSSEMFLIGTVSPQALHVVHVAANALIRGIGAIAPGRPLGAIAEAIEPYVVEQGCSVVRQYTGHGVGKKFHEFFTVCHHITSDCEPVVLQPGMTLTVEPMVNIGSYKVITDGKDGWTVRTKDGSLSAQFEHTVLVTETGHEIMTRTPSQIASNILINIPTQ